MNVSKVNFFRCQSTVDNDPAFVAHHHLVGDIFDGADNLQALPALVGNQQKMSHFVHDTSVDLFNL